MTTIRVATAATIPATAAATAAGAPRITAPTAASATPTTISASFTQLNPFWSISKKFVTAIMEPPITPAMPATVGPMLTMTFLTAENTEPILENAAASFGNSSAKTSENVPAPPERSWNPSTSFGTTPTAVFTWPAKELTADAAILILPAAAFAAFIVIMAAAIVPRAFPNASITAGSAPARESNIP